MFDLKSDELLNGSELIREWKNSDYANLFIAIDGLKDDFESLYSKNLQKSIDDCKTTGMSGKFDSFEMKSMSSAGRLLITLEDFQDSENTKGIKTQITFICAEGEEIPRMGWQSFYGSFPDIKFLVENAISEISQLEHSDLCNHYKSDRNIDIL